MTKDTTKSTAKDAAAKDVVQDAATRDTAKDTAKDVVGVLLAQIGTPKEPNTREVRRYLRRFLSDRRVIDLSPWLWQPLLQSVILTVRPRRSAKLYRQVWTAEGSPLRVTAERQRAKLQELLGERFRVETGLSYSEPEFGHAMQRLAAAGANRILVLPLYPQYSSTTTAAIYDQVCLAVLGTSGRSSSTGRFVPALRLAGAFYDHPGYIAALKSHLQERLDGLSRRPDQFLLSFHGIPLRYADSGDPYPEQCLETSRLLAEAMGWREGEWQTVFQSRFGPGQWTEPYAFSVIGELAKQGVERPFLFAPGFASDCLETLYELGAEGKRVFEEAGGKGESFTVAPCLNDSPAWMEFLRDYVIAQTEGWQ